LKLPPVRTAVPLRRGAGEAPGPLSRLFPGRAVELYDSGTAALAVALQDARRRHHSDRPEALVPAYGCPQLVSACLYAKVRPRIVDTAPGQWGYAPDSLRAALSPDTVAILAVNLLGVGDQAADLLPLARENGSCLIQDSAQHVPVGTPQDWCAEYVVLSFGRGKPINLLRGGALAVAGERPLPTDVPVMAGLRDRVREAFMGSRAAGLAFNAVTHPRVYGLAARLPGLRVGETRYHPLGQVARLPPAAWRQVGPGYEAYARVPQELAWSAVLPEWESLGIRMLTCLSASASPQAGRLRLALLADAVDLRDRCVEVLNRQGLGASIMYGAALDGLAAIPAEVREQGPFPNATSLADRLFTLPTHRFVSADSVRQVHDCLVRMLGR
jgi:hypothetical protein